MTEDLKPRCPADSETVMHELILPTHTNALGTAFGGTIMSWVDICAAICAQRHSSGIVVTASIDQLDFIAPVRLGDIVRLTARVSYVGSTSIEVRVLVHVLNNAYTEEQRAGTAYVTFVAVADGNRRRRVPPLDLTNARDRRRFEAGKQRREHRLAIRAQKAAQAAAEAEEEAQDS